MKIRFSKTMIGMLVLLIVLGFAIWNNYSSLSKESLARTMYARMTVDHLSEELVKYRLTYGRYPNESNWFIELRKNKQITDFLTKIPVKNNVPLDPWGTPYQYSNPGKYNTDAFDLWTFGADFGPEGKGENKDITNWNKKS